MRLILGGIAALLLGTLTACGYETSQADSEPERAACQLLNAADREKIDGTAIDRVMPVEAAVPRENQCGWASKKANIRVMSMSASTWALTLPKALDAIQKSPQVELDATDRAQIAEADKLLDDKALKPDQACALFVTLAKLDPENAGTNEVVRYLPLTVGKDTMTISAQTCSDGRFTSVSYTTDGMERSLELEETMAELRYVAHRRGTRLGL